MLHNIHPTPFIVCPSDEFAKNIDLRNLSRNLAKKYADGHVVTDDDLQIMGRNLWNMLGIQDDFDTAVIAAGDAILSVIIKSDKPEVQAYPWETLYHPTHGFIGRNSAFTLTRRIEERKPEQATLDKGPLRVLLFTSLPDNLNEGRGRLNVEEEQAQVQEALLPWIASGVVQLEMPDDGRFSTLKELLEHFDPHMLFLSGHGRFHHEPHADDAYGEFLFESETGDGEAIRDEEIARVLAETRVQAVVLSACESGKAACDYLSNGLVQRISAEGIPNVIGMRESILDVAGIQFARALCDALAGQERLDVALQSARVAIQKTIDERGQWCLPMALLLNPQVGLIDWDFQPQAVEAQRLNQCVNNVSIPARFVGRRAELRRYKIKLTQGALRSLLITGAGGLGKTSLAGKLALDVQKACGDELFAWSANSEKSWRDFELEMGQTLDKPRVEQYDKFLPSAESEAARAKYLLNLLAEQFNGRVILFFDNLEALQDADSLVVKDATVAAWIEAACGTDGVTVFATSRWQIPDWDGEHLILARANYGDFLQIAAIKKLPIKREQMRRVYEVLGGNIRGLEFFDSAVKELSEHEADELLEKLQGIEEPLAEVKKKLQANMAIAEIFSRLPENAKKLLARLPAYHEPVQMEGLLKLGTDLPGAEKLLERLLAVSLLEARDNLQWNVAEYQCALMVIDWMNEKGLIDNSLEWLNIVADYQSDLFENERKTLPQAIRAHHALRRAEQHDEADRLVLDYIVNPLETAGFYVILLKDWLPAICMSKKLETRGYAFMKIGNLHCAIGDYGQSLMNLNKAREIFQKLNDKANEGNVIGIIATVNLHQGDYGSARKYMEESLQILRMFNNKAGECTILSSISASYHAQGNYEMALAYVKQSLSISQQIGDKAGESTALNNISAIYWAQGDYEAALTYLKQSLAISQQIGDKAGEGVMLNNISQIYYAQGNYETALTYLKQSLAISKKVSNKAGEGLALNNISQIYDVQGDYETALIYAKQSLVVRRQIGDKTGEGMTLGNIGNILSTHGDYDMALTYTTQSLAISRQIGDKASEGAALNNIAMLYHSRGDYEMALTYLKQSLVIRRQIGDKAGEGTTLNNLSQIFKALGNYEMALTYLKQSLTISQLISDKAGEGMTLNNIAMLHHSRGDYQKALTYLKQSLVISQEIGDKAGEGTTLNNISQTYDAQGDYEMALTYLKQSLVISQEIGDKAGEGITLGNIGNVFSSQGDYEMALTYLKQSLAISQEIGDKASEGITLGNMGNVFSSQGDYEMAQTYLKQSLAISQEISNRAGEGTTLNNISALYLAQGDYETALMYLKQSLALMQQIGDKAGLCTTLFNIGHIHAQSKNMQEAVSTWVNVYLIAKQINDYETLQALSNLAPKLGLPEGLEGWEDLAQRIQRGEKIEFGQREEVSKTEKTRRFVHGLAQAVREKNSEAQKYFESTSKMAVDSNVPSHERELGKVLQKFMAGVKSPDLSGLPDDVRKIVEEELRNR